MRSLLLAPIVPQRGATMVVAVVSTRRPFGPADRELLRSLARRAAQALTNAHLYEEAQRARASAEQSTREAREAQSQFRTAFQEAPIGVALVSVRRPDRGRHERVNAVLCGITGYDAAELRERTIFDITHPEDRDAFRALVDDARAQWQIEQRLVHRNGHPLWVQVCGSVVRGQDDEPLQWIVHVLDITDRKRYEGQLQYLADHDAADRALQPAPARGGARPRAAVRDALQRAGVAARRRRRQLQVRQRHVRARGRRRGARPGRRASCAAARATRTWWRASAATSSRSCSRTPTTPRPSPWPRTSSRRSATTPLVTVGEQAVYVTASSASRRSARRRARRRRRS